METPFRAPIQRGVTMTIAKKACKNFLSLQRARYECVTKIFTKLLSFLNGGHHARETPPRRRRGMEGEG